MRAQRGLTLVEVVVALVVFAIGVVGLQAGTVAVLAQLNRARQRALADAAIAARFERLHWLPCAAVSAGSENYRGITTSWTVTGAAGSLDARVVSTFSLSGAPRAEEFLGAVRCR